MSSQWVDADGGQWKFSTVTASWRKLVNGSWVITPLPPGGLQRVVPNTPAQTVTAPPWPADDPTVQPPQWLDAQGDPWRYNPTTGGWQKLVGSSWVASPQPAGGLRRINTANYTPEVVVVETMGPPGPQGEIGPPGLTYIAEAETLPSEDQNGVNTTFTLSAPADLSQAIQVFRNGLLEVPGLGYLVANNSVTFTTPPLDSDVLTVIYQRAQ